MASFLNRGRVAPLIALVVLAALPAFAPGAQAASVTGSGRSASEARSVGEFQRVVSRGSIDVVVRQGAETRVQVQADDNLLPLLETALEGRGADATLTVRWMAGASVSARTRPVVTVVMPRLASLAGSGSGDFRVERFSTPALKLALSGSGDAQLVGLTADELSVQVSGSSNVRGEGRAGRLGISISGSGDVRLFDLKADEVSVRIAGSGDAAVHASRTLTVRIAGSGDVVYDGEAAVTSTVAGSGSVKKK